MDKRAAKAAYREKPQDWAICAVRIGAAAWVTLKPDVSALENRLGFMLRQGGEAAPGMRAAYAVAGAVTVEAVERLDPKLSALARETLAEARLAHWAGALGARVF